MQNYLEHKTKVQLIDGLLGHSQEWQWFIDAVEQSFHIDEIRTWDEYQNNTNIIREVYENFVRIQRVCEKKWNFKKPEFEELWKIAQFYIGGITESECEAQIHTMYSKVAFFCIWVTKLTNSDTNTEFTYDIRPMTQYNYFEIVDMEAFEADEEQLLNYAKIINLDGFSDLIQCLKDNIDGIVHPCSVHFMERHKNALYNYNTFSFQLIKEDNIYSWQESYLLDMVKVEFRDRAIIPFATFGDTATPDISLWTPEIISAMRRYFNYSVADFVLNTINYVHNCVKLPAETILEHCSFLSEEIKTGKNFNRIYRSSSFQILSYVFKDRMLDNLGDKQDFRALLQAIQDITDPRIILKLKEARYPVTKEQIKIIKEFCSNKYKSIDSVYDATSLLKYLKDKDITSEITAEYCKYLGDKFDQIIVQQRDLTTASIFYAYMVFLINVNQKNKAIDKRLIFKEMIRIQEKWENDVYGKMCENMQCFSHEETIPQKQIEKASNLFLTNPILLANNCVACSEGKMVQIMEEVSENPIGSLFTRTSIEPQFPIEGDRVQFERHDIDKIHLDIFRDLLDKKGYRLQNIMQPEDFVDKMHRSIAFSTQIAMAMFVKVKELYEIVKSDSEIPLIDYTDNLSLAMVTQLFPLLEIKIRKLAKLFGIFPYKKSAEEFMQCNDPSSLLREMLESLYGILKGFENVPDLLFVYHTMYNSNSLNIRNQCVHGRSYINKSQLPFAFRTTLFAIYMICFRIKTIEANVSDIQIP